MRVHVAALVAPVCLAAAPAFAEPAPEAPAPQTPVPTPTAEATATTPAKDKTVDSVTVNGAQQTYKSSIDRKSYSIDRDLQTTSGSISDALRNLPGVTVDIQGAVTLRGQSVTIMVDGKPTTQFRGDAGAQALQAVSADQYERVEVITNPSAEFSPEGTGGIINLISRKNRKPGYSASVKANAGDSGRYNASVSGGYNDRKLNITANGSLRREPQKYATERDRSVIDPLGGSADSVDLVNSFYRVQVYRGDLSATYDVDDKNRLSAGVLASSIRFHGFDWDHFVGSAGDPPTVAYDQYDEFLNRNATETLQAGWLHTFGDSHDLKIDASQDFTSGTNAWPNTITTTLPEASQTFQAFRTQNMFRQSELKAAYRRPMAHGASLKLGYELTYDDDGFDRFSSQGPTPTDQAPIADLTNRFVIKRAVNAVYGNYERTFGDLTVLPGLRLEEIDTRMAQPTSATHIKDSYLRAYPTLHLSYRLSDALKLTGSYSRRVRRPGESELNPNRRYSDPYTYSAGNPYLKPEVTDSYEVGLERSRDGANLQLTAFYRAKHDEITEVEENLGGGVLLTTRANVGHSHSGGLETSATGKLSKTLSYNLTGDAYWSDLDASNLGLTNHRSGWSGTIQGSLSWQATAKDFVQLSVNAWSRENTAQGYWDGSGLVNLGYRHKVDDRMSVVVTARDIAGTLKNVGVTDTPTIHERTRFTNNYKAVFVGLTYAFGGNGKSPPKEQGFDFGGGGGGPR